MLIVEDCHRVVLHRGQKQTLTELRVQYWIIRGKSFVKKVLLNCIICKRCNGRPYAYPKIPPLPRERVEGEIPFKATGGDHLGPVHIKNVFESNEEADLHKSFITLYTCASSRGVILDLVPDTSAESFISSCTRFISRRGCPHVFLSDNGTAFTAKETREFASRKNIEWKFSIAEAPWFGGFWERLVACVKNCLKKTIGRTTLRYDEMQTVLCEIEMILNSRPLVTLYDDTMEETITPNHLLFGRKLNPVNYDNELNVRVVHPDKRLKYMELVLAHFWKRWSSEYLTSLREFHKNYKKNQGNVPYVDDILIIKEDKLPRQQWRFGRILELIKSRDGNVRAAKIFVGKTKRVIERPINRLYPLECANRKELINIESIVGKDVINKKREAALMADIKMKFIRY